MELLRSQIQGLKTALQELREKECLFIKSQTLKEQEEKARSFLDKVEEKVEELKKKKSSLREQRAEILKSALDPLAKTATALLPKGQVVISLDEKLFIGWQDGARIIPYAGLSGGEKVFFDGALANALLKGAGQKILVLEGGELDLENLRHTLLKISEAQPKAQIIVNTWVPIRNEHIPEGWKLVLLQ